MGISWAFGWPFVLIVFCLFVFYLFPILVLRASVITMPELVEIKLVSDDDNSLIDRHHNSIFHMLKGKLTPKPVEALGRYSN